MNLRPALLFALTAGCAAGAPVPSTSSAPITALPPITPRGVYAHFEISHAIASGWVADCSQPHSLCDLYSKLLATPGISGLALGVHWDDVQPLGPAIDLSNVDHAFDAALAANQGQTIILGLSPGIHTPDWVFTGAYGEAVLKPITSCDGWFDGGTADTHCGSVTFERYPEQNGAPQARFPVPWDQRYQERYTWFLQDVAGHYGANGPNPQYASVLAAVSIAGPTGASPELILPANTRTPEPGTNGPDHPTAGWLDWDPTGVHGIWNTLLANQGQQQTAFVQAWNDEIDQYATYFSGLTLILTPDNGQALPVFTAMPSTFAHTECYEPTRTGTDDNASCTAVAAIMQHLFAVPAIDNDAIALMTGGMTAASSTVLFDGQAATTSGVSGTIGVPGIKYVLGDPSQAQSPVVGGAEFDHPLTDGSICDMTTGQTCLQKMGCVLGDNCDVTPWQAMYNVFSVFFYRTHGANDFHYSAVQPVPAPDPLPPITHMSYVYVDFKDVLYAGHPKDVPTWIDTGSGSECVTVQYMLTVASSHLTSANPLPPPTCL